ncbi:MAG: ribulose-phosphate 3-epimerase [Elusimicrobia bacterium]|nr:ribulose-phosphate 3-epimerase [Elusimicrobiota bacterium]
MIVAAKSPVVVPSLLAGDLSRLGEHLDAVKAAGCRWISVDVMDGHFVPNLSFGPGFVKLAKARGFRVDAHLMVANPLEVAPWFADAGADIVTLHIEAVPDAPAALGKIRSLGVKAGLAAKPKTSVDGLVAAVERCDLVLVMTVEPGFGGQKFMPDMVPKIEALRQAVDSRRLDCWIQVDGGLNAANISQAAAAGADSLVAGSAVFAASDPAAAFRELELKARAAFGAKNKT